MYKSSAGFSLVELIVVITILGILAGVAYPSYKNYRIKSNVNNMYVYGKGLQAIIADEFIESGDENFQKISIQTSVEPPTEEAFFKNGKLTLKGTEDAGNVELTLTPTYHTDTGKIKWSCEGEGEENYLPKGCK